MKAAWLQIVFRISSFVFSRTKKFKQVWKKIEDELMIFHIWMNYPFNKLHFGCSEENVSGPTSHV